MLRHLVPRFNPTRRGVQLSGKNSEPSDHSNPNERCQNRLPSESFRRGRKRHAESQDKPWANQHYPLRLDDAQNRHYGEETGKIEKEPPHRPGTTKQRENQTNSDREPGAYTGNPIPRSNRLAYEQAVEVINPVRRETQCMEVRVWAVMHLGQESCE